MRLGPWLYREGKVAPLISGAMCRGQALGPVAFLLLQQSIS